MIRTIFTLVIFLSASICLAQTKDFSFNGSKYEYEFGSTANGQFQFSICKGVITDKKTGAATCDKQFSLPVSKDLDQVVFEEQFDEVMKALDASNAAAMADSAAKNAYEEERKKLYDFSKLKTEEKSEFGKLNDEFITNFKELLKEKANRKAIGYFKLKGKDLPVSIKESENNGQENLKEVEKLKISDIDNIEIVLSAGSIRKKGIKVLLKDGRVFRNDKSPVTLYRFDKRKGDRLFLDDKRGEKVPFIELGDLFNYVYLGKFSYPSDGIAYISPDKPVDSLLVGHTISDYLDVSVFSDLLALLGRKANGIIQTQIAATFITNTGNVRNKDITFHNFIKPYIQLAKFDSKFSQVDNDNIKFNSPTDTIINRLYLNQIAYLQAGLKVNLVRIGIGNNQQFFLNFGADINLTNADSLLKKDITSINYYPELNYQVNRLDNFGLECSVRYLRQEVAKNSPFTNREGIWIFNPQATLYYYPFSNPDNKIYLRYNHFAQIGNGKYNYPQFQFGFKTNLFSKKEGVSPDN
ncbi:MAG: hypothetical protein QM791_11195 [Ferruginibacter sp.]